MYGQVAERVVCVHTESGKINPSLCRQYSSDPEKNAECCNADCSHKSRQCRACVRDDTITDGSCVIDQYAGLCAFHIDYGENTKRDEYVSPEANGVALRKPNRKKSPEQLLAEQRQHFEEGTLLLSKAVKSGQEIREIAVGSIRRFENQPRLSFDEEGLRSLGQSLLVVQVTEIKVRQLSPEEIDPKEPQILYELIDGERRWRASRIVGKPTLRAVVSTISDNGVQHAVSTIANFGREDHTVVEEARAIREIKENLDITLPKIAELLGKSYAWTQQRLSLLKLHPEVQQMMDRTIPKEKRLRFSVAQSLTKYVDQDFQLRLAREVVEENLPFGKATRRIKNAAKKESVGQDKRRRKDRPAHFFKSVNATASSWIDRAEFLTEKVDEMGVVRLSRDAKAKSQALNNLRLAKRKLDTLIKTLEKRS